MSTARAAVKLYDHRGLEVRSQPYHSAGTGRRSVHWYPTNESMNSLLAGSMSTLRARSRDMFRKSSLASTVLERFVDSAVGTGIRPLPNMKDAGQRREVIDAFEYWSENECDADGRCSFYGLQEVAGREIREVGEVFARLRARTRDENLSVPLQIQLLESEQCDETDTRILSTQREVKLGVEFDRLGRRRAYWFYVRHPGDVNFAFAPRSVIEKKPIPADSILHCYDILRAGQVRGIPPIVVVLSKLKDISETDDAYIVKQKIGALFAGFIRKPLEESNPLGTLAGNEDDEGSKLIGLEPGILQELLPGEEITFSNPPEVGGDFVTWFRDQQRMVASNFNVMYEMASGDLTGVNYSSIRAGMIWHRRSVARWQANVLIRQFCHPIFRRWYADGILAGELKPVKDTRDGIPRVRWIPTPGWAQVDPDKETRSNERQIRSGQLTRTMLQIESAIDPEEFDEERKAENDRADRLGHIFDSDPRVTNQSGALQGKAAPKQVVAPAGAKPAPKPAAPPKGAA